MSSAVARQATVQLTRRWKRFYRAPYNLSAEARAGAMLYLRTASGTFISSTMIVGLTPQHGEGGKIVGWIAVRADGSTTALASFYSAPGRIESALPHLFRNRRQSRPRVPSGGSSCPIRTRSSASPRRATRVSVRRSSPPQRRMGFLRFYRPEHLSASEIRAPVPRGPAPKAAPGEVHGWVDAPSSRRLP
jgi:hypothetical protein